MAVRVVLIIFAAMFKYLISLCAVGAYATPCAAQEAADTTESGGKELQEVVITAGKGTRKLRGATNSELISASELKRAACCNLGESFTTNPSVDVNYNDAATGPGRYACWGCQAPMCSS